MSILIPMGIGFLVLAALIFAFWVASKLVYCGELYLVLLLLMVAISWFAGTLVTGGAYLP